MGDLLGDIKPRAWTGEAMLVGGYCAACGWAARTSDNMLGGGCKDSRQTGPCNNTDLKIGQETM